MFLLFEENQNRQVETHHRFRCDNVPLGLPELREVEEDAFDVGV